MHLPQTKFWKSITKQQIDICRDPDDNKFLECAVDAKAIYIVSGDKDLLTLEKYANVEIITAREFCDRYISQKRKRQDKWKIKIRASLHSNQKSKDHLPYSVFAGKL